MQGARTVVHVLIIITNSTALLVTARCPKIMRVRANRIFASLLLCHLLYGIVDTVWEYTQPMILTAFNFYLVQSGLLLMLMLTIDRIFAIKAPFKYEMATMKITYFMIIFCFTIPLTLLILQMIFQPKDFKFQALAVMILIVFHIVVLTISNLLLLHVTRKHIKLAEKQISSLKKNYPSSPPHSSSSLPEDSYEANRQYHENNTSGQETHVSVGKISVYTNGAQSPSKDSVTNAWSKREVRAAYTCIGMVLSFTVLALPWLIERVIRFSTGYKNELFWRIALFLTACASVVDPIIYILFNRQLRKKMFGTFLILRKKANASSNVFESGTSMDSQT